VPSASPSWPAANTPSFSELHISEAIAVFEGLAAAIGGLWTVAEKRTERDAHRAEGAGHAFGLVQVARYRYLGLGL